MTDPDPPAGPPPEITASRIAHDGFVRVRVDNVRYASGREGAVEVVDHPGSVTVIAVDREERLLLVRQYRHPAGREMLELPAGTLEPGESPETCAERELQEETGYRPGRLERLGGFFLAPGYCSEYQHVFLTTELTESRLEGDEEAIHLERVTLDEALRMVASGEMEDAKTAGALLLYQQTRGTI